MNLETLRLLRNILLRATVISVLFLIIVQISVVPFWDVWQSLVVSRFHADAAQFANLILSFLTAIKFYLLFILLAPGLAIHWTLQKELARKG